MQRGKFITDCIRKTIAEELKKIFYWAGFPSKKDKRYDSYVSVDTGVEYSICSMRRLKARDKHISMRGILPIFLFIFVLLFLLPPSLLSQRDKVRVTEEKANIYTQPDINSTVAETVEKGTLLYLFSTDRIQDKWYRIYYYSDKKKTTVVGYIQISMVGEISVAPKVVEEIKPKEKIEEAVYDPPKNLRVIALKADIRAEPDRESQIIQEVSSSTEVLAIGKTGKWYRVNLPPDKEGIILLGYIHEDLVEEVAEEIKEVPKIKEIKPKVPPPPKKKIYRRRRVEAGPKSCIGVNAGYAMPQEDLYSEGVNYGANFTLGINRYLSIELSGLRFQSEVESSVLGFSNGKLTVMPVQLSIQVRLPVTTRFIPYIHGGGGYYLNSFALDEEIIDTWDALGFTVEERIESSIGYHFGAGLDLFITEKISLSADFRYCLVKSKGSWSLTDRISEAIMSGDLENLKLDTMMFGAGLKYYF